MAASVWPRIIDYCTVQILCIKRTLEYRTAIVVLWDVGDVSYKIYLLVLSQASKHLFLPYIAINYRFFWFSILFNSFNFTIMILFVVLISLLFVVAWSLCGATEKNAIFKFEPSFRPWSERKRSTHPKIEKISLS